MQETQLENETVSMDTHHLSSAPMPELQWLSWYEHLTRIQEIPACMDLNSFASIVPIINRYAILAAGYPTGSPIRPRKKFRRCRLMEFDDSPTTPKVPKVAVLESDNSDSDDLPSATTGMYIWT